MTKTTLCVCVLVSLCFSQTPEEYYSDYHFGNGLKRSQSNGFFWQMMDEFNKIIYLNGQQDGQMMFISFIAEIRIESRNDKKSLLKFVNDDIYMASASPKILAKELDIFYNQPSNLKIPIIEAYLICLKKHKGAKDAVIEDMTTEKRKIYN